jgi:hypothetical protein
VADLDTAAEPAPNASDDVVRADAGGLVVYDDSVRRET